MRTIETDENRNKHEELRDMMEVDEKVYNHEENEVKLKAPDVKVISSPNITKSNFYQKIIKDKIDKIKFSQDDVLIKEAEEKRIEEERNIKKKILQDTIDKNLAIEKLEKKLSTQPQPKSQPQSQPQYRPKPQPQYRPQPQPQPQPQYRTHSQHQHMPQPQPQHRPQSQPQHKPKTKPIESKPEIRKTKEIYVNTEKEQIIKSFDDFVEKEKKLKNVENPYPLKDDQSKNTLIQKSKNLSLKIDVKSAIEKKETPNVPNLPPPDNKMLDSDFISQLYEKSIKDKETQREKKFSNLN
jgi:hypothetical protein